MGIDSNNVRKISKSVAMTAQLLMGDTSSFSVKLSGASADCIKMDEESSSQSSAATTSCSETATLTTIRQGRRRVCFSTLDVYEFPQILGDHPGVSRGAPLALAPQHCHHVHLSVAYFESRRKARKATKKDLLTSQEEREQYLLAQGYSLPEIRQAAAEALKTRRKREKQCRTYERLPCHDTLHIVWEVAMKSLISRPKEESAASLLQRHEACWAA
jgi:hypothetical protein